MTGRRSPARLLGAWGDPLGPAAGRPLGTALFLLLVAVVAFHDLGARSVHTLDLPRFGVLAREMLRTGEWLVPQRFGEVYANKPPLHIWLVAAPAALFGEGEVTPFLIRLPSAVGLVLLVCFTSAWGRLREGSFSAGRAAALLLLGTYAVTRFGREGRPDMLASGLAVGGAYFLDRLALGRGRCGDVGWTGLLFGLTLLAKGPPLLILPLIVLFLPSSGRSLRVRLASAKPARVLAIALAVAALWFVPAVMHGGWAYGKALLLDQATDRMAGTSTHVEPWHHYAVRIVDGGAPWTPLYLMSLILLFLPWRRWLQDTRSLVVAGGLTLAAFSLVPTKHVRYVIGVFSLLAIGAGALVARFLARRSERIWPWLHAAGGLVVGSGAAMLMLPGRIPSSARSALVIPAAGLLLLALATVRTRPRTEPPRAACRRLVGTILVGVVLSVHAYWIVRDRYRVRPRDAFDRAVAEALLPDVPVFTVHPLEPGHVFHGAPSAQLVRSAAGLPSPTASPRALVLVERARREEVEAARGQDAHVLLDQRMGDSWPDVLLLSFGSR